MGSRYASVAGFSLFITFGLLFLMQALIAIDEVILDDPTDVFIVDYRRIVRDPEPVPEKDRVPERPDPQDVPPPLEPFSPPRDGGGGAVIEVIEPLTDSAMLDTTGPAIARDADVVPIVRVSPTYPAGMAARGIEGWVEVEFSIGKLGEVRMPRVTASSNQGFERAALRAIRHWRYRPGIEQGQPVERHGIRVRLAFELDPTRT